MPKHAAQPKPSDKAKPSDQAKAADKAKSPAPTNAASAKAAASGPIAPAPYGQRLQDQAQQVKPPPIAPVVPAAPALEPPPRTSLAAARQRLDDSEGRGHPKATAHARAQHVGLSDEDLDARGKAVATSFLTAHDQDKAAASVRQGGQYWNAVKGAQDHGRAGTLEDAADEYEGPDGKSAGWKATAPLTRVAEWNDATGQYDHFNAKVTEAFTKISPDDDMGSRIQTMYPSAYKKLEQPLPGGAVPKDKVELDSIADAKAKLRSAPAPSHHDHTGKKIKSPDAVGKVVDKPKAKPAAPPSAGPAKAPATPDPAAPQTMSKSAKRRARAKQKKAAD